MATVWTTMEKTTEGRFVESGYHTTEPEKWYRCFTVEDPQEFIEHMRRFNSIPKKPLSRTEYEKVCQDFDVSPAEDQDLKIYGTTLTTLGTSNYHYHTDPANRQSGIENTIHGLRYRELQKEVE